MRGILILLIIKWLFENFSQLNPQVQSGWIAGLTAMITTVLTVTITQLVASHNLKKTLAENRETARESQQENKEALDRTLKANENNLNRTLASSKETLRLTLDAEKAKHEAQLTEQRADRLFEARREIASRCLNAIQQYRNTKNQKSDKQIIALDILKEKLQAEQGDLILLFPPEVSGIAYQIQTQSAFMRSQHKLEQRSEKYSEIPSRAMDNNEITDKEPLPDVTSTASRISFQNQKLTDLLESFTAEVTKELGTYQESPAIEEA